MSTRVIIKPQKGWLSINFRELFEFRELIWFLAHRDIMAQYKQAFFGVAWAVIKPVFSVLAYTLVFGKVAGLSSSGIPYPLFTLCGVAAWSFFTAAINQSTTSLIFNTNLITKIYFPRLILPISSLGRGAVDFFVSFVLLIVLMAIYGFVPQSTLVFLPLFILLELNMIFGVGFFFSAITVKYRDLQAAIPVIAQWWFYLTPVAWGLENITGRLKLFFYINPMTWIIEGFRWSILGVGEMDWRKVLFAGLFSFLVLFAGLYYFRKMENEFADII